MAALLPAWLAQAGTSTAMSPAFTVDLQSLVGGLAVSGRVLAAATRQPLSGASVSLAGQNTSTAANGTFSLANVSLASGNTLTVSKSGFMTDTESPNIPAGSKSITLPDILLQATATGKPVVTKVEPGLKGLFLSGASLNNDFTASVNWNGLSPGYVRFYGNAVQIADKTGSGPDYVCTIDMAGASFRPAFDAHANQVKVVAVSSTGQASDPFLAYLGILPMPDPLKLLTGQGWPFTTYLDGHVGLDFDFPNPPIKAVLDLPIIGRYGFEFAANGSFDYTVTDGDWEAAIGLGAEGKQG
ncbi:MAG: carboxypeptidase regulatory-like domain-containing protein, partial [Verrucomicrobia bacterium]|nr:carboxypeptidase regulatory-like domain-containing protein [Verrucomicrobiota bacterium]